jgi:hypothetical protein
MSDSFRLPSSGDGNTKSLQSPSGRTSFKIASARRQRHAVHSFHLHALGRDSPFLFEQVDFGPGGAECFTGAGAGEDRPFERQFRGDADPFRRPAVS